MADWEKIKSRGNVEDRRSLRPAVVGGISLTGIALYLLINYISGGSIGSGLQEVGKTIIQEHNQQVQTENTEEYAGEDSYKIFTSSVLGSTNDLWTEIFNAMGKTYTKPKLVLFREATESGCGGATSQIGPHYCSSDKTIYLDETFFDEIKLRYGTQIDDVGQAYVISHEVGHHVQNVLGILDKNIDDNETSVKTELQADCFAGVWANSIKYENILGPGEIQEAMDAAASVGDDRIQEKAQGYINPETFTHGTSEERVKWFTIGYDKGRVDDCDTFR